MAIFAGSLRKLLLRWTSDRDFHKNLAVMINRIALSAGHTYKFNLSTRRNSKFLGAFFTHKMPFLDCRIRAHGAVANLSNNTDLHFSFRFHSRTPRLRLVPKPLRFAHLRRLKFLNPIPTVKAWPDVLEKAVPLELYQLLDVISHGRASNPRSSPRPANTLLLPEIWGRPSSVVFPDTRFLRHTGQCVRCTHAHKNLHHAYRAQRPNFQPAIRERQATSVQPWLIVWPVAERKAMLRGTFQTGALRLCEATPSGFTFCTRH